MNRTGPAAVLIACAALAGACTGDGKAQPPPPAPVRPVVVPAAAVVQAEPGRGVDVPGAQSPGTEIVGFGFRLRLRWRLVTEELPAQVAHELALDAAEALAASGPPTPSPPAARPVRAAAGHELVLVQLSAMPGGLDGRRPGDKDGSARPELVVGERRVTLARLPRTAEVILLSVPKGAPVQARLTEYGRTQSMDLRTGAPGPDAIPAMVGPRSARMPFEHVATGDVTVRGATRPFSVRLVSRTSEFQPHLPATGWAAPGRMWVSTAVDITTDGTPPPDSPPGPFGVGFGLDVAKTFTLVLPSGQRIAARAQPPVVTATGPGVHCDVVFDVPAELGAGTLHITPTGTMTALYPDGPLPARWNTAPAAADFPLTGTA